MYGLEPIIGQLGLDKGIVGWTVLKKGKRYREFLGDKSKNEALAWIHQRTTQVFPGLAPPQKEENLGDAFNETQRIQGHVPTLNPNQPMQMRLV